MSKLTIHDKQVNEIKKHFEPLLKEFEEEDISTPSMLYFFDDTNLYPRAQLILPPFKSQGHKEKMLALAMSALFLFETKNICYVTNAWVSGMKPDEYDEWMKMNKSLSEHPLSSSALMISYWKNKNCVMTVQKYSRNDDGTIKFLEPEKMDGENHGGLIPTLIETAFDTLNDEDDSSELKKVMKAAPNSFLDFLSSQDILISIETKMAERLGIDMGKQDD